MAFKMRNKLSRHDLSRGIDALTGWIVIDISHNEMSCLDSVDSKIFEVIDGYRVSFHWVGNYG